MLRHNAGFSCATEAKERSSRLVTARPTPTRRFTSAATRCWASTPCASALHRSHFGGIRSDTFVITANAATTSSFFLPLSLSRKYWLVSNAAISFANAYIANWLIDTPSNTEYFSIRAFSPRGTRIVSTLFFSSATATPPSPQKCWRRHNPDPEIQHPCPVVTYVARDQVLTSAGYGQLHEHVVTGVQ